MRMAQWTVCGLRQVRGRHETKKQRIPISSDRHTHGRHATAPRIRHTRRPRQPARLTELARADRNNE